MIYLFPFLIEIILLFLFSQKIAQSLFLVTYKLTKSREVAIGIVSIFLFPGTVIHELSHYLVANILFVRTGNMDLVPKIVKDQIHLGSVQITKTDPIRRMIIGVAPFFVGLVILLSTVNYVYNSSIIQTIELGNIGFFNFLIFFGVFYILLVITNTMFSSKKDMEGVVELFLTILVIFLIMHFLGFTLPWILLNNLINNAGFIDFMKTMDLLLAVPLVINLLIYSTFKLIKN